eukprot:gnl/TRDRNA2_/TRDRNA2_193753_c0_seq1.p1 gnl/TRDRNA2_/TRDRNA2_193753_c0~~gnl/TRDRNA2_/TRDRNA2_193753_c0_seq1.p1  ORF type:complete len:165 (+),score=24.95 gnl/TRDRNA2_/TRDRNA2_193753_c0_seq1:26-496(+)
MWADTRLSGGSRPSLTHRNDGASLWIAAAGGAAAEAPEKPARQFSEQQLTAFKACFAGSDRFTPEILSKALGALGVQQSQFASYQEFNEFVTEMLNTHVTYVRANDSGASPGSSHGEPRRLPRPAPSTSPFEFTVRLQQPQPVRPSRVLRSVTAHS